MSTAIVVRHNNQNADTDVTTFLAFNPNAASGWRKALDIMARIKSWEDVETYLLRGAGLSARTYESYLSAVRGLYNHTGGLNPFQVTPGHVESYLDSIIAKGGKRNTAAARAYGLQRFFRSLAALAPGWVSPFETMTPALRRKLFKAQKVQTKRALTTMELRDLLTWLKANDHAGYGMVALLAGSGLRASEAAALTWGDVEHDTDMGAWFAVGIGKGSKPFRQEIGIPEALENLGSKREGPLLRRHDGTAMDRKALAYVVGQIGKRAIAAGIVKGTRRIQWSPHLFRRTFATVLYAAGVKVKALAELTRHASVETLATHYLDDHERSAPVFEKILGGGAA